ncbi:MAG TPA: hypothetical protein VL588_04145 [Bdellovibrionota bacterium]|jgi:hypothetical protein|nr:hypothetical protein [Bdellovibrionota bacterium]
MPRFEQLPETRRTGAGWTTKPGDEACSTLNSLPYHTFRTYCDPSLRKIVIERTTIRMEYSDDGRGGCTGTEVKSVARLFTDKDCRPDGTTGMSDAEAESEWHAWQKLHGADESENLLTGGASTAGKSTGGKPAAAKKTSKPAKKAKKASKKPAKRAAKKPAKKAAKKAARKPAKKAAKKKPAAKKKRK